MNKIHQVNPEDIQIGKDWNPRFDFSKQRQLNLDVLKNGVKTPVILQKTGKGYLVLRDGERRLIAALEAQRKGKDMMIPAYIEYSNLRPSYFLLSLLRSNFEDRDVKKLLPIEEASSYTKLVKYYKYSINRIAEELNQKPKHIRKMLTMMKGCKEVQKVLEENEKPIRLRLKKRIKRLRLS